MVTVKRHQRFAKIALELAYAVNGDVTYQLCALVIKKNRVLSVGYNSKKTHPMMNTKTQQRHAECDAILRCPEDDLSGADLVVVRARSKAKAGLARPCGACREMLKHCGIKHVFYTTNWDDETTPNIEQLDISV